MSDFGAAPPPDFLDDFSNRLRSLRLDRAARVAAAASEQQSAEALGEARQLAERLGSPLANVLADVEHARTVALQSEVTQPSFERDFPTLTSRLDGDDFQFLTMMRDDLGNLKSTEGALGWLGRSFDNSFDNIQRTIGTTIGRFTGIESPESPAERQVRLERQQVAAQRDGDNWGADAVNVLTSLGATLTGGALGFAVGGPVGAAVGAGSVGFSLSYGEVYTTLIDEGYTPAQAGPLAGGWGTVMAALDMVGAGRVASAFSKTVGKKLVPMLVSKGVPLETKKQLLLSAVKEYALDIGVESVTEVLQQAAVIAARAQAHSNYRTGDFETDISGELWDTFVHTFRGMVLVGLPGTGVRIADSYRRSANAQQTAKAHERIEKLEAESKLRTRSPNARAAFVNDAAPDDMKTVYIRPERLIETVEAFAQDPTTADVREQLEESFPGIMDRARQAVEDGTDVEVPIGEWSAKLSQSELGRALMPHAVFHQDADTAAEREELNPLEGDYEQMSGEVAEKAAQDEEFRQQLNDVYDHFYSQAVGARRVAGEARAFASLARNVIVSLARAEGLTLAEYVEKHPLPTVQRVADVAEAGVPLFEQLRRKPGAFMRSAPKPKRDVREDFKTGKMPFEKIPSEERTLTGTLESSKFSAPAKVRIRAIGEQEFAFSLDASETADGEQVPGTTGVFALEEGKLELTQLGDISKDSLSRLLLLLRSLGEDVRGSVRRLRPVEGEGEYGTVEGYKAEEVSMFDAGGESPDPARQQLIEALRYAGVYVPPMTGRFYDGNSDHFSSRFHFFSALAEEIDALGDKRMRAQGWKDLLNKLQATGKVKSDEIFWSGVEDWLDAQTGKVGAAEVMSFLAQKVTTVDLRERDLGRGDRDPADMESDEVWFIMNPNHRGAIDEAAVYQGELYYSEDEAQDAWSEALSERAQEALDDAGIYVTEDEETGEWRLINDRVSDVEVYATESEAYDALDEIRHQFEEIIAENFYVTTAQRHEVDEDYRDEMRGDPERDREGRQVFGAYTVGGVGSDLEGHYRELSVNLEGPSTLYSDGHAFGDSFDGNSMNENILLHMRTTDRRTAKRMERVLFVEEIQSDWSQEAGKGEGFGLSFLLTEEQKQIAEDTYQRLRARQAELTKQLDTMREEATAKVEREMKRRTGSTTRDEFLRDQENYKQVEARAKLAVANDPHYSGLLQDNYRYKTAVDEEARAILTNEWAALVAEVKASDELTALQARFDAVHEKWKLVQAQIDDIDPRKGNPAAPFVASVNKFVVMRDGKPVTDANGKPQRYDSEESAQQAADTFVVDKGDGTLLMNAKGTAVQRFKTQANAEKAIAMPAWKVAKLGDAVEMEAPQSDRGAILRLGAKRALLLAAQEGYDMVSFITGRQTADFYGIGSVLREVKVQVDPVEGTRTLRLYQLRGGQPLRWDVDSKGIISGGGSRVDGKPLADAVGRDAAKAFMEAEDGASFSGAGLDFGAEGYRRIYEEVLPAELKPILKQIGAELTVEEIDLGGPKYNRRPLTPKQARERYEAGETIYTSTAEEDRVAVSRENNRRDLVAGMDSGRVKFFLPTEGSPQLSVRITDDVRAKLAEGLPLFQDERGGFSPQLNKILLSPDADSSTLFHEMSHFYLEEVSRIAKKQGPESAAWKDIEAILKWKKLSPATWFTMTLEERRAIHEAFALNFERWLYEGKAPSADMASLFQRIRAWLVAVYTDVVKKLNRAYRDRFGEDLPGLTDEVRAVFGRMVTSEAEVRAAFEAQQFEVLFATEEEFVAAGGTPDDYAKLLEKHQQAEEEAIDELTRKRLRSMELASGATQGMLKTLQRRHVVRRREIRKEVEAKRRNSRVERARSWLRNGEHLDENGELVSTVGQNTSHKLNRGAVKSRVDERTLKKLEEAKALTNTGVDPDVIAPMFDYESGEQLIEAIVNEPEFGDAVRRETDARMLAEHPELTDEKRIREQVAEAVHNKVRRQIVAQELRLLDRSETPVRMIRKAAKNVARRRVATMDVKDATASRFVIAARRARREASKAIREGDLNMARAAKRRELLAESMGEAAAEFRQERERAEKMWRKAFRPDKKLQQTRDMNVVLILRSLLATLDAGRRQTDPDRYLAEVSKYAPELVAELTPRLNRARQLLVEKGLQIPRDNRPRYESLTVEEFREFAALAEMMWNQSRRVREIELDGRRMLREEAVDEAKASLAASVEEAAERGLKGDITRMEDVTGWVKDYFAFLTRVEHLFRQIGGIFPKLFVRVKEAANAKRKELRAAARDIQKDLLALDLGDRGVIHSKELDYTFGNRVKAKAEILGMALHFYSHAADSKGVSNRDKLLRGYGWTAEAVETFLDKMQTEGILTAADFEWMQSVYDRNASYLDRVQKAHYRAYGFYMKTIKTEPFQTQFGEFKGGYVPARANPKKVSRVASFDQDRLADAYSTWPVYERGFSLERSAAVSHKLDFNIGNQILHVESVLNFIHMHPAVRDVSMVLNNYEVQETINRDLGHKFVTHVIEPWLKRSAEQSLGPPPDSIQSKLLAWLARGAQMGTMFLNVVNALQNYTGFGPILRETKAAYISRAAARYMRNPRKAGRDAAAISDEMAERMERQVFEITSESNQILLGDNRIKRAGQWINRNTYILQTATQHTVDVIGWWAKHDQTFAEQLALGVDADTAAVTAVREADSLIRRTQMSGAPEDISSFEGLGGMRKAIAPFKSWFINWLNYTANRTRSDLKKEGVDRVASLLATYATTVLMPGVVATLIADGLRGDFEDEEDDGYFDDFAGLVARAHLDLFTGPLPLVGDTIRVSGAFFDDQVWNNRMPSAPYTRLLEKLARIPSSLADGEGNVGVDLFDAVSAIGAALHVPLEAFGKRIRFIEGLEPDDGAGEIVRGLLGGR